MITVQKDGEKIVFLGRIENDEDYAKVTQTIENEILLNRENPKLFVFQDANNNEYGHLIVRFLLIMSEKYNLNSEKFKVYFGNENLRTFAREISPMGLVKFLSSSSRRRD